MTELCLPVPPMRCWQYHKNAPDESPVPLWVAKHLEGDEEGLSFVYPDSSNEWTLDDGDWIVELQAGKEKLFGTYTDAQFRKRFVIVPPPAESGPTARSEGETT